RWKALSGAVWRLPELRSRTRLARLADADAPSPWRPQHDRDAGHHDPGAARARAGGRASALAATAGRLVEGRARDERHDRRRGSLPAALPRAARSAADPLDGALDPLEAARGRKLGDLLRRSSGSLDDGRGLHRAPARWRPRG